MMAHNTHKHQQRELIKKQTEEFLKRGGKITELHITDKRYDYSTVLKKREGTMDG